MLPTALVHEIDRLVRDGKLSQRQIATHLNVSRGIVSAIARGRRGLYGKDPLDDDSPLAPTSPPVRCPHCGYRVYEPCIVCRTRAHRQRQRLFALLARTTPYHHTKRTA